MASLSRILAVDLGASSVRLVELGPDQKGRPAVLAVSEEEIPFDPAKTSDFFPLYAQALTAALGRLPGKTRQCHLCLGGPAVFARILKVPVADPGKVGSMIGFEAQQTVPAIEQALWDFQVLPSPQPGEVEALILAIKRETVEELSAAAASVGLKPQSVTLAPAALFNALLFNYPDTAGCSLILDLGARASTILLAEGNRLFVRVVPLGGGAVSQAIATDLQESFAGAEVLKKAKGFVHPGGAYEDPADAAAARISKLARGVMTRLHTEVERSVTFFRSQQGGSKPTRAWLSGGGALLGHTDLFFQEKLKIPVEYFQPFRRLAIAAGAQAVSRNFPAWAVAAGTALEGMGEAPVKINVLGAVGRSQAQAQKNHPAIVGLALATVLLCFLPGLHFFWQAGKVRGQVGPKMAEVEATERALGQLETEHKKLTGAWQVWDRALSFEIERIRWPLLLAELQRRSQEKMWITGLEVQTQPAPGEAGAGAKTAPDAKPTPVVEIRGMFETASAEADAQAVEKFREALNAGGVLRNVQVLEREAPEYVEGKTEQVALQFRLRAEWPEAETKPPAGKKES